MMRNGFLCSIVVFAGVCAGLFAFGRMANADNAYHALSPSAPFVQDWSNTELINLADDWTLVPSITGYNDNVPDNVGADPQSQLIPSATPDVNPNQNNPALYSTGGVTEFDRAVGIDPVVALQGASNSDYPNIDIRLNTTACASPSSINVSYNLRDIDSSGDNAVQQIALQYRVGNSGNYTNIPAGYVADATTGPNLATLVTPVSVVLPADAQGQPQVHLRVITSNAVNNDEWVGVDDINITCTGGNTAPMIDSSAPTSATEDVQYTYNATSTDADGPGEAWSLLPEHSCGGAIDADTGVFQFTPAGPVPPASCVLAVQVCDGGSPSLCASQSTTVNIDPVNDAPSITSSIPTAATEDTAYSYVPTRIDADGPGQAWSLVPGTHTCGGVIDPVSGAFSFTPAGPVPAESCDVAIKVCDGGTPDLCAMQSATVTIEAANDAPSITSAAPTEATEDEVYTYDAAFSDPDGTGGSWSVVSPAHTCGGSIEPASGQFSFTPAGPVPPASCVVAVRVCDDEMACSAIQSTTVTIAAVNDAPVFGTTPAGTAVEDILYTYNAGIEDPDGPDEIWSLLPAHTCGGTIDPATGAISFTPAGPVPAASCTLAVRACDGATPGLCSDQTATVTITAVNDAPTINTFVPANATEDEVYIYNAGFTDPDGTGAAWELVAATHTCGGSISAAGQFTFTPAGPVPAGSCVLSVRVCDDDTACSPAQTETLNIIAVNDAPIAVDDSLNTAGGTPLVVNAAVLAANDTDPDGPGLTVVSVSNPIDGTVDLSSGTVTFTPASGFSGQAGFDYTVSDGSLTDTGHVTVSVSVAEFSGTLNVGAGEAITSLTNGGGLFEQLNNGVVSGNLTVNITTDLTAETGDHVLNQLNEVGTGGYSILVQAGGAPVTIEGTNAASLITLNGADRVTFSGLAFGPQGLTFRNLGNGQTFRFGNDATGNSIDSCVVESGTVTIFFANGAVTGNDGNSVTNNIIRARTTNPAVPSRAILSDGQPSLAVRNSGLLISDNTILDFEIAGVSLLDAEDFSVTGNSFGQTGPRLLNAAVETDRSSGLNVIDRNTISNFTIDGAFSAIALGEAGSTVVSRNRIFAINGSNDPSFTSLAGITLVGSTTSPTAVSIQNNMISIAPSIPVQGEIYGIHDRSNANDSVIAAHNTILLSGPSAGSPQSFGFLRSVSTPSNVSLINNIFFNDRGIGAANYAIGDLSPSQGAWSSDHNLFVGTGGTAENFFNLGGTPVNFAAWQAGPPSRDANSLASVLNEGPFNVANMFASADDPHLAVGGNNPAVNRGTDAGVPGDIDLELRPLNGVPDIGADEVLVATTAADASISGRVVTSGGQGIRNIRVTVAGPLGVRVAVTNNFGYYRFDGLEAGGVYVVGVEGKRYAFEVPSRVISLDEDAVNIDFTGEPR